MKLSLGENEITVYLNIKTFNQERGAIPFKNAWVMEIEYTLGLRKQINA
jgi:hypothetical protein